ILVNRCERKFDCQLVFDRRDQLDGGQRVHPERCEGIARADALRPDAKDRPNDRRESLAKIPADRDAGRHVAQRATSSSEPSRKPVRHVFRRSLPLDVFGTPPTAKTLTAANVIPCSSETAVRTRSITSPMHRRDVSGSLSNRRGSISSAS